MTTPLKDLPNGLLWGNEYIIDPEYEETTITLLQLPTIIIKKENNMNSEFHLNNFLKECSIELLKVQGLENKLELVYLLTEFCILITDLRCALYQAENGIVPINISRAILKRKPHNETPL
jgi:hypothetical protein